MNLLAIDTAARLCAACVYDMQTAQERGRMVLDLGKGHAEHVMPVIQKALRQAGLGYDDLDAVAVSVGPGSFTGVRVGVAAARGLAVALGIPAVGVTTLEALVMEARASFAGRAVLSVLGRPNALAMMYLDASASTRDGPRLASLEEAARIASSHQPVLVGEAAQTLSEFAGGSFDLGSQAATADISFYARLAASRPLTKEKPKPFYLRAADAKPQTGYALPHRGG